MNGLPPDINRLLPSDEPLPDLSPDERMIGMLLLRLVKAGKLSQVDVTLFRKRASLLFEWHQAGGYICKGDD